MTPHSPTHRFTFRPCYMLSRVFIVDPSYTAPSRLLALLLLLFLLAYYDSRVVASVYVGLFGDVKVYTRDLA